MYNANVAWHIQYIPIFDLMAIFHAGEPGLTSSPLVFYL